MSQSAIAAAPHTKASLILLPLLLSATHAQSAIAQIYPTDSTTQSVVNETETQIDITGGQSASDGSNLFHSFEQFDLPTQQTANFITTPDTQHVIGTVNGAQPSIIDGTLQVSGSEASLYLVNPAGILFGPNARLNLTGSFSATTATGVSFGEEQLRIGDSANYAAYVGAPTAFLFNRPQAGAVVNLGELSVSSGEALSLIGGTTVNAGSLSAPEGSITVAAVKGNQIVRVTRGDRLLSFEVEAANYAGDDSADSAHIASPIDISEMLTGSGLGHGTQFVTRVDGTVQITSSSAISEAGGAAIATGNLFATGEVGGDINIIGESVSLFEATLDASGDNGGGIIRVGGDYKGGSHLFSANQTVVDAESHLIADAISAGNGGRVVVWSDRSTRYEGHLSARGGVADGDGGFAEVSGKVGLAVTGSVDLSAPAGRVGTALFDPKNITITDTLPTPSGTTDNLFLSSSAVEALSESADVVLEADNNILIEAIADGALTFSPNRSVTFRADADGRDGGEFRVENIADAIEVTGGNVTISGAGITAGSIHVTADYAEGEANNAALGNITLESSERLQAEELISERGHVSLFANEITVGLVDTSSNDLNSGGETIGESSRVAAGDVTIHSSGDVFVEEILAYGDRLYDHHSPDGGNVTITSADGSIEIARAVRTYSSVDGYGAGSAGDITLSARDSIFINTDEIAGTSLGAASKAATYDSGDGGDIVLSALAGSIHIAGNIETSAETRDGSGDSSNSAAGNAGSVTLIAGADITAGRILSRAVAAAAPPGNDAENAGAGGDIVISAADGNATIGKIESYSSADSSSALGGGSVGISAVNVSVQGIDTSTRADSNAQGSGDITIHAQNSVLVDGELESYSYARRGDDAGEGGNVSIAGNRVTAGSIETWSLARDGASASGGDVTIAQYSEERENFVLVEGDIQTYSFANDEDAGSGGSVFIDMGRDTRADLATTVTITGREGSNSSIETSSIALDENAADAGDIEIYADIINIGTLKAQSIGDEDAARAGQITLRGDRVLTVDDIIATSSDQRGGLISLSGDDIELTGDRIIGDLIRLAPATLSRNINIGPTDAAGEALNISTSEIAAIESHIEIGNAASTGTVSLAEGVVTMAGTRWPIHILGGDRLIGPDRDPNRENSETTYALTGEGSGSIVDANISFSSIEEIQGGAGNDIFKLGSGVAIEDYSAIRGGSGSNVLSYEAFTDESLTIDLSWVSLGDLTLIGPAAQNTLQGADENNSWQMTGVGQGILNSDLTFKNFASIIGGSAADTLDYSEYGSAITVSLDGESTGLSSFESIERIIGSAADSDELIGSKGDDTFTLSSLSSANQIDFTGIERVNGGEGANTFIAQQDASDIRIVGGSDLDNSQSQNRLVANTNTATWRIDSKNAGTLTQSESLIAFEEIQHIETSRDESSEGTGEMLVLFTHPTSQITGSISSGNSDLALVGDDINIGHGDGKGDNRSGLVSGTGALTIRPATLSNAIELGGQDGYGGQVLNLTAGELAAIQDGFSEIVIGDRDMTGSVSLNDSVQFRDSVVLISKGEINTTAGEILLADQGALSLITEASIVGASLSTAGGNVVAIAEGEIRLGDITTSGAAGSGDVQLTAGDRLTVGNIITSEINNSRVTGSVDLLSASRIEIESIEAEGQQAVEAESTDAEDGSVGGRVSITAADTFTAAGATSRGSSLSTVGTADGSITITFGSEETDARRFTVGDLEAPLTDDLIDEPLSENLLDRQGGTVGAIASNQTSIESGEFIGSYRQGNIELINRGLAAVALPPVPTDTPVSAPEVPVNKVPTSEVEVPTPEVPTTEAPTTEVLVEETPAAAAPIGSEERAVAPNPQRRLTLNTSVERSETIAVPAAERSRESDLFQQIEANIGQGFAQYFGLNAASEQPSATLIQVQKQLDEVAQASGIAPALVYVYFVPDAASEAAVQADGYEVSDQDQLEVMLVTANGSPTRHRQWGVTRSQVTEAMRQLREQTTSQFSTAQQYLPPAQQLYDWIVAPVSASLAEQRVQSLGFVMETGLRTMPIAALHDGDRHLIETYSLGILPTFSLTDFESSRSSDGDFRDEAVLAMGASKFQDQPDLPAVDEEVELITQQLWEGDAFLNEDFVLTNLQTQISDSDYGIVHLATHATFKSDDIDGSYIQLWDQKLGLQDVSNIGLSEAEIGLIILSACNTALGDRNSEYGFAGFAISAGSPSALASLWPVSDEGTLGFMSQFYSELRPAPIRAEALRQAQLSLLSGEIGIDYGDIYGPDGETIVTIPELSESGQWDFSHPFYWSAFTMIGNPW